MHSPEANPRRTIQQLEQEAEENLRRADPHKAKEFVESHSLRKKEGEKWVKYPLNCDIKELGGYGIGLLLYFNFLKKMAILMGVLSIIAIPSLVSNCIGNGLDESTSKLVATTLANQPKLTVVVPEGVNLTTVQKGTSEYQKLVDANVQAANDYNDLVNRNILLVAVPDLVYSVIFFIFIIYLRTDSRILIEILIHDFVAEVSGFPETEVNPAALQKHFEQFGEIVEVCLARNYHNTLMYNKQQAKLASLIVTEEKRIEYDRSRNTKKLQLMKKQRRQMIAKIEEKLAKKQLAGKKTTFGDGLHKEFSAIVCGIFGRLKKTTAPDDILWENLDIKWHESMLRKLTSAVMVFFLMLLTFVIIFAAQLQGSSSTSGCSSNLTIESTASGDSETINCFCSQYSTQKIFTDNEIRDVCWNYGLQQAGFQAISVAASFVIVVVNFLLKTVLITLSKFERYHTVTEETLSSMMKVFVAMFFNTACITLLVSARFGGTTGDNVGIVIAREIGKIIPPLGDYVETNKGQYPNDLDRLWYANVGNKIIYTWIINIVSPHLIYFLMTPIIRCLRNRSARQSFIQKDMNLWSIGPNFEMIPKYALALNTIFVTMFYSSGMPILLFFATLSLFLQYFVEKYLILRFYCRPPTYNHEINTITLRMIPMAIILHLAMGIYTYGSEDIFLKEIQFPDFGNGSSDVQFSSTVLYFSPLLLERIQKVVYCFIGLLFLAAFYFLDLTFFRMISRFFKSLLRKRQVRASVPNVNTTYQGNETELKQQGLNTYEIRANSNYRDLVNSIDTMDIENQTNSIRTKVPKKDELIKLTEVDSPDRKRKG